MTGREIVRATLDFECPERAALNLFKMGRDYDDTTWGVMSKVVGFDGDWHSPEFAADKYPELKDFRGEVRYDEFGSLWGRLPGDFGCGEVLYGAITDWAQLDGYELPDLAAGYRFADMKAGFEAEPDKFRMAGLPGFPFALMRYIRKMEFFLEDLLLEPEKVLRLNEMVMEKLLAMVDMIAASGAEAVFTCEDWGTQDRLLVSPALWRELFRPSLQRIFDRIHEHGMYAIMHSCGYIWDILPDLVEMGVDSMQFDAPTLMGMEPVCELFGKKVTLFSPVDIQKILPESEREVRAAARQMIDMFAPKGGGLILKDYGDYKTLQIPQENVDAMHDEFICYGAGLKRYY